MGKGTIISGGDNGQYQVSIEYNTDRVEAEKTANLAKIADLETQITAAADEKTKNTLKLQKTSLEKRNETLDSIKKSETISAWCADLTEDLSGTVGTIEVPGESQAFNIRPGYEDNAAHNSSRDGQLVPTMAQTPEQSFYNLAMLPGWQKWKPTYRYATINYIDYVSNTANITLSDATSTQQNLNVNAEISYADVDIEYMDCNAAAFESGDDVIVKFVGQDKDSPKIIGFKDNPKPCLGFFIRPKFNGNYAVKGGEYIKILYTLDGVEREVIKTISAEDTDLESYTPISLDEVPPRAIDETDITIELYTWKIENPDDKFIDGPISETCTFCHWAECSAADPDALEYDIREKVGDTPVYVTVKRVLYKEATTKLAACETETLTYEDKEYTVYVPHFNNLKVLKRSPTTSDVEVVTPMDSGASDYWASRLYAAFAAFGSRPSSGQPEYDPPFEDLYYHSFTTHTKSLIYPVLNDDSFSGDCYNAVEGVTNYETTYVWYIDRHNEELTYTYNADATYAFVLVNENNEPINTVSFSRTMATDAEVKVCDPAPWCECLDEYDYYDGGLYRVRWDFSTVDTPSEWF